MVSVTLVLASYAALVSTIALFVSYRSYRSSGAVVRMFYQTPVHALDSYPWPATLSVHNAGRQAVDVVAFGVTLGAPFSELGWMWFQTREWLAHWIRPLRWGLHRGPMLRANVNDEDIAGPGLPFRLEGHSMQQWEVNVYPAMKTWRDEPFPNWYYGGEPLHLWAQLGSGRIVRSAANLRISGSIVQRLLEEMRQAEDSAEEDHGNIPPTL